MFPDDVRPAAEKKAAVQNVASAASAFEEAKRAPVEPQPKPDQPKPGGPRLAL